MHMKINNDSIAYYVTNYKDADKALAGSGVIATVAMEFSKFPSVVAGAPKFTKFYVYDKDGNLVNRAELDNRGDKYVPGLCIVCHGGTLPADLNLASPKGNTDSRFIPFDLKSFEVSPLKPGFPALLPRAQQEESFRKLNAGVHLHTGATDAQKALIDAWYESGVSTVGETQNDTITNIPFNWATGTAADRSYYYDVIRPSCRACHTARGPGLDFGDPASVQGTDFAICSGYMPQSFVTWRNFWHSVSPHQPTKVEQYFGLAAGSCVGPQ
jgi:mono/diheme cytochrome c family protein